MIWIITSWVENYKLIQLCQEHHLPYIVFADTLYRPYQDRSDEFLLERFEFLANKAQEAWCTQLLVSPRLELLVDPNNSPLPVISLFHSYLHYAFQRSLIGKIGYFGGYYDISYINTHHKNLASSYILTDTQRQIKKFLSPLRKWTKDTSMWTFFLRLFSKRQMMINKIIKFDLRYFKDANIDTLIPLSYEYFNYQTTITHFFNQKKQKFHKRDVVRELFGELVKDMTFDTLSSTCYIYISGSPHFLQQKRHEIIVSEGGKFEIEYKQI